jgi:hypothetical protein
MTHAARAPEGRAGRMTHAARAPEGRAGRMRRLAAALLAVAACKTESPTAPTDAGGDAGAPTNRPARPEPTEDAGTCASDCEATHAAGVPKDGAVVACWEERCNDECILFRTTDAGAAGDAGAVCTAVPIVTPTAACDACTRDRCCAEWTACFSDAACTAYNECLNACP